MQLFDVIAGDWEPERDALVRVSDIDSHQGVPDAVVASEHEDAKVLIPIPVVEEEVRPTTDVEPKPSNTQQLANEADNGLTEIVIEKVPTQRPQQRYPTRSGIREEVVLGELLPLPKHRHAFAHEETNQVGLQQVPTAAVALREEGVLRFVRIVGAEVAQKALVIMVLDVLQPCFGDVVTVHGFLV